MGMGPTISRDVGVTDVDGEWAVHLQGEFSKNLTII